MSTSVLSSSGGPSQAEAGVSPIVLAHRAPGGSARARLGALLPTMLLAMMLVVPTVALAAPKVPPLTNLTWIVGTKPDGQSLVIVSGELPASTPLPATVVMPVPAGSQPASQPVWAGELLGGDPSKDPTATYTILPTATYGLLTMTLRTGRTAQAEFLNVVARSGAGTVYSASVPIVGTVDQAVLSFEPPSGSKVTTTSLGLVKAASGGIERYTITKASPPVGSTLDGSLVFSAASSGATGTAAGGTSPVSGATPGTSLLGAVLALVAGFGGFALWANRDKLAVLMKGTASKQVAAPTGPSPRASKPRVQPPVARKGKPDAAADDEDEDYFSTDDDAPQPAKKRAARP